MIPIYGLVAMNIIYYLGSFPKLSASFVLNEIYELEQSGHNVAVCALNNPNENIVHEEFNQLNIPTYYFQRPSYINIIDLISKKTLHPRILKQTAYRAPIKSHVANLFRAKRCIDFVESLGWDPDHFHAHFAGGSKFGAKYASNYFEVPFTVTTHAADLYKGPKKNSIVSLLQSATRIVTISEYNKKRIHEQYTSATPIDIIRAGIRPEKFASTNGSESNRILTISRFVEKKGLKYALEAVNIVTEAFPDLEYHLIGSGELEHDLRQKTQKLGINENVSFLNNVTDKRLVSELDKASCFLLPCVVAESGDRDGIPVVLMEAMAMETPPISTNISGIPELIENKTNGILTKPRDPEATADAIMSLLKNESIREKYGKVARKKIVSDYNINTETKKLEDTFQTAHDMSTQ